MIPLLLGWLIGEVPAQKASANWLRVMTESDFVIDVDKTSLTIEPGGRIKADFRTTFLEDQPAVKMKAVYRIRIDSIEFDLPKIRYRILDAKLLGASNNVVFSSHNESDQDWRPTWGKTSHTLLSAASQLTPFGTWRIVSYRYLSGDAPSPGDPEELKSLVGTEVLLSLQGVKVAKAVCDTPTFEPKKGDDDEFMKLVFDSLPSAGIDTKNAEAFLLQCGGKSQFPLRTVLLRTSNDKALLLWKSVFLEIERPGNVFRP